MIRTGGYFRGKGFLIKIDNRQSTIDNPAVIGLLLLLVLLFFREALFGLGFFYAVDIGFMDLPTRAYAMYAPELKGNSDEIKLKIED